MSKSQGRNQNETTSKREGLRAKKLHRFEAEYKADPAFPRELFIDITNACNH